jgi:fumarylacetoacetase
VGLESYIAIFLYKQPGWRKQGVFEPSHNPTMAPKRSWLNISPNSHFSLANIPFGIITTPNNARRSIATAIGDYAFDLRTYVESLTINPASPLDSGLLKDILKHKDAIDEPTLNLFASRGRSVTAAIRKHVQDLFAIDTKYGALLRDNDQVKGETLIPMDKVTLHLPFTIGDYTDFYVGLHHAMNCGRLMRGPGQELQPNYKHLPVGYHGRASSVVISGTPITRPSGQILPAPGAASPVFSACRKLDFELELGCFVSRANAMGQPVPLGEAEDHLFGVVLMNDWSARDIQTWEMVPLGPFNAKNFGTTVSGWVVTMDALQPFLVPGLESDRELLSYMKGGKEGRVVDINLEVDIQSKKVELIFSI